MSTTISRIYSFLDDKNNGVPITATRVDAELDQQITSLNQKVLIKATAPATPIAGMLWLDSTNKILKQYRSSEWVHMGVVYVSTSEMATPQNGDIWLDTTNNVIKFYNDSAWHTNFSVLENDTFLVGTDNAGTGTVDIIKVNSSDTIIIGDGAELASDAAPTTDAGVSNKKYVDDAIAAADISQILDYGTSASESTERAQSAIKICYGVLSISGASSASLSNLPFSSATSYVLVATFGTATDASEALVVTQGSGSSATIYNNDNLAQTARWIAIGT